MSIIPAKIRDRPVFDSRWDQFPFDNSRYFCAYTVHFVFVLSARGFVFCELFCVWWWLHAGSHFRGIVDFLADLVFLSAILVETGSAAREESGSDEDGQWLGEFSLKAE